MRLFRATNRNCHGSDPGRVRRALFAASISFLAIVSTVNRILAADSQPGYPYQVSPTAAIKLLTGLSDSVGQPISISADELRLFADARNGQLHDLSFGEAALLASGATDAAKRKLYLARLDELENGARQATADAKTALGKGEQLLKFLHAGPLAKGYEGNQTDLSGILESGHFNCVSSAVLYNVLARRLGLDVRAVEIPGHVFAVLYDGPTGVDVETTNSLGFNPSNETREKIELQDGSESVPERHHGERREVNDAGLAAIIYYNHGVLLSKEDRFSEAAAVNLSALALDPSNPAAAKNLMADLNNWSLELDKTTRYEQAIAVVTLALKLDPKDGSVQTNRRAIWHDYAASLVKAEQYERAVAVVRRAASEISDLDSAAEQARLFEEGGEEAIRADRWDAAIALAGHGLENVDSAARNDIQNWRGGVFLRQSNAAYSAGDFKRAADVLEAGLKLSPTDDRLKNNVAFLAQEWARSLEAKEGGAAALDILQALGRRFPQIDQIKQVAANQVRELVQTQANQGKYADALAGIENHSDALNGSEEAANLAVYVYDAWAKKSMDSKDWSAAIGVFEKGLKKLPGNGHLTNNLAYCRQELKKSSSGL